MIEFLNYASSGVILTSSPDPLFIALVVKNSKTMKTNSIVLTPKMAAFFVALSQTKNFFFSHELGFRCFF